MGFKFPEKKRDTLEGFKDFNLTHGRAGAVACRGRFRGLLGGGRLGLFGDLVGQALEEHRFDAAHGKAGLGFRA